MGRGSPTKTRVWNTKIWPQLFFGRNSTTLLFSRSHCYWLGSQYKCTVCVLKCSVCALSGRREKSVFGFHKKRASRYRQLRYRTRASLVGFLNIPISSSFAPTGALYAMMHNYRYVHYRYADSNFLRFSPQYFY